MTNVRFALLCLTLVLLVGCSSIRGERVETGFGSPATSAVESVPATALLGAERSERLLQEVTTQVPIGLGREDATASFDFQARELYSGSIIEGAELFGQGQVLVTFVQPGCDITAGGSSAIAEIAQEHPEAIFVIVHSGADDEAYRAFAEDALLFEENMMHLSDTHGAIAKRYNIDAYPTTLLIDSERRVTAVTGAMDLESHRAAVTRVTR